MLDRLKIVAALQNVATQLFVGFVQEIDIARTIWLKIATDDQFYQKVSVIKQPVLVPSWQGLLGATINIIPRTDRYIVVAVDGSQIYYDKHQGPPCFLINIGFIQLRYGCPGKAISYGNHPFLTTKFDAENSYASPDFINMQREAYEFDYALEQMLMIHQTVPDELAVCLFDGSLIFFHLDTQDMELKDRFLSYYCSILEQLYARKIIIGGYMSLPKTKELVNLCGLQLADDYKNDIENCPVIDRLTDVDIAQLYLLPHQRSIVFKSKAPICYLYPVHLQPHFCYLHVGTEIVRMEFPAWIAQQEQLVDQLCAVALDQAIKGKGYPVCLFEAHEQAVIKSCDRDFFYQLIEIMSQQKAKQYLISQKSIKKQQPII